MSEVSSNLKGSHRYRPFQICPTVWWLKELVREAPHRMPNSASFANNLVSFPGALGLRLTVRFFFEQFQVTAPFVLGALSICNRCSSGFHVSCHNRPFSKMPRECPKCLKTDGRRSASASSSNSASSSCSLSAYSSPTDITGKQLLLNVFLSRI